MGECKRSQEEPEQTIKYWQLNKSGKVRGKHNY